MDDRQGPQQPSLEVWGDLSAAEAGEVPAVRQVLHQDEVVAVQFTGLPQTLQHSQTQTVS